MCCSDEQSTPTSDLSPFACQCSGPPGVGCLFAQRFGEAVTHAEAAALRDDLATRMRPAVDKATASLMDMARKDAPLRSLLNCITGPPARAVALRILAQLNLPPTAQPSSVQGVTAFIDGIALQGGVAASPFGLTIQGVTAMEEADPSPFAEGPPSSRGSSTTLAPDIHYTAFEDSHTGCLVEEFSVVRSNLRHSDPTRTRRPLVVGDKFLQHVSPPHRATTSDAALLLSAVAAAFGAEPRLLFYLVRGESFFRFVRVEVCPVLQPGAAGTARLLLDAAMHEPAWLSCEALFASRHRGARGDISPEPRYPAQLVLAVSLDGHVTDVTSRYALRPIPLTPTLVDTTLRDINRNIAMRTIDERRSAIHASLVSALEGHERARQQHLLDTMPPFAVMPPDHRAAVEQVAKANAAIDASTADNDHPAPLRRFTGEIDQVLSYLSQKTCVTLPSGETALAHQLLARCVESWPWQPFGTSLLPALASFAVLSSPPGGNVAAHCCHLFESLGLFSANYAYLARHLKSASDALKRTARASPEVTRDATTLAATTLLVVQQCTPAAGVDTVARLAIATQAVITLLSEIRRGDYTLDTTPYWPPYIEATRLVHRIVDRIASFLPSTMMQACAGVAGSQMTEAVKPYHHAIEQTADALLQLMWAAGCGLYHVSECAQLVKRFTEELPAAFRAATVAPGEAPIRYPPNVVKVLQSHLATLQTSAARGGRYNYSQPI